MKREDGGTPLAEVVGRNVQRLRGDTTTDELAKACRRQGLNWGTGRISDLEHGRVSPRLDTLVDLAHALWDVCDRPVYLSDLVEHDGFIALAGGLAIKPAALQRFLGGEPVVISVDDVPRDLEVEKQAREAGVLNPVAIPVPTRRGRGAEAPALWGDLDLDLCAKLSRQSGEPEARMAKALGIHEESLVELSAYLWGRTLSAERNRRAGADANAQDRGRITRQLKAEMKAVLDGKD